MTTTPTISRDTLVRAIAGAKSLENLAAALNIADEWALENGVDTQSIYDTTALQVFSERKIADTAGIYSWDDTRYLICGMDHDRQVWEWHLRPRTDTVVHYFIAVAAKERDRSAILATGTSEQDAVENAAAFTGEPVTEFAALECTKELFDRVNSPAGCFSWDDTGEIADVDVDEYSVDTVVDFITRRMIYAADHGRRMIRDSAGAAEELRPYAVTPTPDLARDQDAYEVAELLQSAALYREAASALDAWLVEHSEREFELVGAETGKVYATVTARNAEHAYAAGEDVGADEDLEARKVVHLD